MKNAESNSSNPDLDYSSDSSFEDYYLYDEQEKRLRNFADRWLVNACEEGLIPWDSDPVAIANFLREINEKFGWNIPIDTDDIKKKLAVTDERIKKMSKLYQEQHKINPPTEENWKNESVMKRRHCSNSSPSNLEARTSHSEATQVSDSMCTDENPVQETMVAENQERPEVVVAATANQEPPQGGRGASVLFIRRLLNKTDICNHQNRLSMPCNQVVNDEFLTAEEREKLRKNLWVAAKLIDPDDRIYDVYLRLTRAGLSTRSYAIGKPWNEIKRNNGFRAGMELDVRGFRGDGGQLCFLLQRVD